MLIKYNQRVVDTGEMSDWGIYGFDPEIRFNNRNHTRGSAYLEFESLLEAQRALDIIWESLGVAMLDLDAESARSQATTELPARAELYLRLRPESIRSSEGLAKLLGSPLCQTLKTQIRLELAPENHPEAQEFLIVKGELLPGSDVSVSRNVEKGDWFYFLRES